MAPLPNNRLLVYGGNTVPKDVWVYDLLGNFWTMITPINFGPVVPAYTGVYDAVSDSFILYQLVYGALTRYNFDTNTWTDLPGGIAPASLSGHRAVINSKRSIFVIGTSTTYSGRVVQVEVNLRSTERYGV